MRCTQRVPAAALCVALTGLARAEPAAPTPTAGAPLLRVLPNGLHVTANVDRGAPLVAVDIRYGVGDAMDPPGLPGLAQAIGNILFDGATGHTRAYEVPKFFYAAGLGSMERGVRVDEDETHITLLTPASGLELGLWIEAERMGFAASGSDVRSASGFRFPGQVPVGSISPLVNLGAIAQRAVFGPQHPYFLEAFDDPSRGLTPRLVSQRLREWYTPANASIAVAGDIQPEMVAALVEKYFGGVTAGRPPVLPSALPSVGSHEVHVTAAVESPTLAYVWATPARFEAENLALDVAAAALDVRLQSRLVDSGHANDVAVFQKSMRLGSMFVIRAERSDDRDKDRTSDEINDELEKIRRGEIDDTVFASAKRRVLLDAAVTRDSLVRRTSSDNETSAEFGQPGHSEELFRRYGAIDASAVTAATSRFLSTSNRVAIEVEPDARAPKGGVAHGEPARAFRVPAATPVGEQRDGPLWYHAPGLEPPLAFAPQRAAEASTKNGVRLSVVTRPALPIVRFRVFAPWAASLPSLETFRAIPQALALAPAGGETLEARLASVGAHSRFTGDVAGLSVWVASTPDASSDCLRLVLEALRHPTLQKDEAGELRKRLSFLSKHGPEISNPFGQFSGRTYDQAGQRSWPALDVPTTTPFSQKELERLLQTAWTQEIAVSFVGAVTTEDAIRAVELADGTRSRGERQSPTIHRVNAAAPKYDFVQDDYSSSASFVFSCFLPETAESSASTADLAAVFSGTFGHSRGVWNGSTSAVRVHDGHFFYVDFTVGADDVEKAVSALLERASRVRAGTLLDAGERRSLRREELAWLASAFDSTQQQLERISVLGPDLGSIYAALERSPEIDISGAQRLAERCFARESLRIVAYGKLQGAVTVLKTDGYGPIHWSTVSRGVRR